jgi:hypothetical protein
MLPHRAETILKTNARRSPRLTYESAEFRGLG